MTKYIPKRGDWVYLKPIYDDRVRYHDIYIVTTEANEQIGGPAYKNAVDLTLVKKTRFHDLLIALSDDVYGRQIGDEIWKVVREHFQYYDVSFYDTIGLIPCIPIDCLVFISSQRDREKWEKK